MHTKVTMSFPFSKALEDKKYQFHPFTRESLAAIEVRISNKLQKEETKSENCYYDEDPVELHHELQEGKYLPFRSHANFPSELISSPVEEIDSFYEFQKTFVVINKRKCIFRFSATNSLWFLDPFNTNRRAAIFIVTHPLFSLFLDIIIVSNCIVLTQPVDFIRQFFSFIFIGIFSLEMALNVIARGFVLEPFTYLRDSWNCLDFILLTSGYMSMILHVRDLDAIRLLKILRSLKVIKGTKLTVYALFESLMKLSTVVILFVISLAVCAVLGLQLYMGRLTQKCMKNFPRDGHSGNLMNESWFEFYSNKAHWYIRDDTSKYTLCGNTSGSRNCPLGYVCLQGFGDNPINSCTSFDTFGWAFLSIFSAVTNDSWEKLFQMILETVSPWHTVYFIMIMLCSVYINCLCFSIINSASNDTVDSIETHEACEEYEQEEAQERARVAAEARETRAHVESEVKMTEHGETGAQDTSDKVLEEKLSNNHCFEEKEEALSSKLNNDEDRNPTLKTKLCAVYLHCREMLCVWECCWWWLRFQDCARCISSSPFFKLFILLCILVNPFFMALYHYNMQNNINIVFTSGRYFFTAVFVIEASLKIISMSPYYYFSKRRNVFDFFITTFCCLEFGLVNIQGLSLLWSLKLCRILSHTWKFSKIRLIICIISRTMIGIGYITFVIICMFSILGIQLFGKYYCDNSERFPHGIVPSGNFVNFLQSFVTVSRVILIGKWMESMKNCMLVGDWICAPYFLVTAAFGKFIMLNFIISSVFMNFKSTNWCLPIIDNDNEINEISEAFHEMKLSFKSYKGRLKDRIIMCLKLTNKKAGIEEQEQKEDEVYEKEESFHDDYIIPDCFPYKCYKQFAFILGNKDSTCTLRWLSLRKKLYMLNCNTYYKKTLLFMIVINSFTLTLEDVNLPQRPVLQDILLYTDLIFTVIFFIDMMICWFAVGFVEYFRKIFCWLDFTITMVSSINFVAFMIAAQRFQALRAIQALRILRVLETVSRMKKLKNVTSNPLVFISPILLYLIPCFIIWHSFAIMGVLLFAGKHHQCVTTNSTILNHDYKDCIAGKYTWKKSAMNFDSIGNAYLVLFQMDMFSTWSWFLEDADASRNICDQRTTGICIYTCLYIVMFYIFSLSTLSIIAAIVVFKYNERITISIFY
ncbi:sodium channel protein PaFPC1-like isoform X2 [Periplaneta americana]|uniref:sodium channel protein PaFPC1-like isoform X2 n=1 Tax=Periplaneta americana TaxID=6978 RepID=UPI0037E7FBBE